MELEKFDVQSLMDKAMEMVMLYAPKLIPESVKPAPTLSLSPPASTF